MQETLFLTDIITQFPQLEAELAKLNPNQYQAATAPLSSSLQVMAGAGTGKTKLMTVRSLFLMCQLHPKMAQPEDVLWIATFSEKAAEKLQLEIGTLYQNIFDRPISKTHNIGTIHSLCNKLLNRFETNTPSKALLDDSQKLLLEENLIELLLSTPTDDLKDRFGNLHPNPKTPLNWQLLNPLFWVPYGLDDFSSLIEEIVSKLIPKIKAYGYLPQQFNDTCKVQNQTSWQFINQFPRHALGSTIFNSLEEAASIWQQYTTPYQENGFSLFPTDFDRQITHLKEGKDKKEHSYLLEKNKFILKADAIIAYNGNRKEFTPIEPQPEFNESLLQLENHLVDLATLVYQLYQAVLNFEGVMDYDDIILNCIDAFKTQPEKAAKIRNQIEALLLDEFQDTNASQLEWVNQIRTQSNSKIPLTVVGDIKQSIYGFRNAQPENLFEVFDKTEAVKTVHLQSNYRSLPQILQVANTHTELIGYDKTAILYPNKVIAEEKQSLQNQQPKVFWHQCQNDKSILKPQLEEQVFITERIETLLTQGQYKPQDIAILVSGHNKAKTLEEALKAKNIPAYRQKKLGFFDHQLYQGLCQLFGLLEDPEQDILLVGLLHNQVSQGTLYALAQAKVSYEKEQKLEAPVSWFTFLNTFFTEQLPQLSPEIIQQEATKTLLLFWKNLVEFIDRFKTEPYHAVLETMMAEGWLERFFNDNLLLEEFDNLQFLLLVLQKWAQGLNQTKTLKHNRGFVLRCLLKAQKNNSIELKLDEDVLNKANRVMILTVHAAKGLEFPVVFYAGVDNKNSKSDNDLMVFEPQFLPKPGFGLFIKKHQKESSFKAAVAKHIWQNPRKQKEKQRLQYVAFTRAEELLFITSWPKGFDFLTPELFGPLIKRLDNNHATH